MRFLYECHNTAFTTACCYERAGDQEEANKLARLSELQI
jgi:hypothetical protein